VRPAWKASANLGHGRLTITLPGVAQLAIRRGPSGKRPTRAGRPAKRIEGLWSSLAIQHILPEAAAGSGPLRNKAVELAFLSGFMTPTDDPGPVNVYELLWKNSRVRHRPARVISARQSRPEGAYSLDLPFAFSSVNRLRSLTLDATLACYKFAIFVASDSAGWIFQDLPLTVNQTQPAIALIKL
jgi:hypothetical protein